jgi:hypothetical protein
MTLSRLTAIVAAALVIAGASTSAQSGQTRRYAGRPLSDVLKALQAEGLRIVFSSELVRADMRVDREPTASGPRQILDEVLAPHLLEARPGPGGSLVIVRATRDPERAPKPAAGTIRGRVVDARTGTPLPGVVVDLQGTSARTVTAADGTFQLDDVPHGSQVLFVSIVGYALARPSVDVRERETTEVTVPLADGTGAYTEVVTVTADAFRRQDAAAPAQQTLTSGDLQDLRGVLADDPFRAVQALPGVTANDDFRIPAYRRDGGRHRHEVARPRGPGARGHRIGRAHERRRVGSGHGHRRRGAAAASGPDRRLDRLRSP